MLASLPPIEFPPLDGSLSILDIVDFNLEHNPRQPAYIFSDDDKPDTVTSISHLEFGRAIHRAAHMVNPSGKLPRGSVVVIMAHLDTFVYQTLVLGLMRAGLVPFPVSPRNSSTAIKHLLKSTSCHRILATPASLGSLTEDIRSSLASEDAEFKLEVEVVPMISQLFPNLGKEKPEHPFSPYAPLHKHFKYTDAGLYLHSSGSTGLPKAIPIPFCNPVEWGGSILSKMKKHEPPLRFGAMSLPPFHTVGFVVQVVYPICGLIPVSVFPPAIWHESDQLRPYEADDVLRHLRRTRSNGVLLIPMMLEGIVDLSDGVDFLRDFEIVAYGGGPMPENLGETLVGAGVNLQASYGTTEIGPASVMQLNRDPNLHWEWIEFSEHVHMRWVPQDDGTYEGQCLTTDTYHPSIENLEDTKGYATSDLFVPHPALERFWKIVGRKDEVIIHSSGEKTVPAPMEKAMMSNDIINGAVMFGHRHNQTGVLLEPVAELHVNTNTNDSNQVAEFRNRAWPFIEEANKDAPAFSKIFKEMILVASSEKPLPCTAKGTVTRKAALKLYGKEIEELYRTVESNTAGEHIALPEAWDGNSLQAWLSQQANDIKSSQTFDSSRDLFEQGFDSLSATILRLRIAGALRQAPKPPNRAILENIVYKHPIIDDLAGYMASFFQNPEGIEKDESPTEAIEHMVEKYSVGLKGTLEHSASGAMQSAEHVVFITGASGNLGSRILEGLLRRSEVTKIYAFNRCSESNPASTRIHDQFDDKGLDIRLLELSKLILLEGDLAQEQLGLPQDIYAEVQNSVTIVIHAAWRLDFNLALASFECNVRGTRNLIDLVGESPNPLRVRLLYTSSIGSAQGWDRERGPYPEEVVYDTSAAVGSGYGESKYVAERILANSGLHATSIRIGQISGGLPNGAWATSDWVPILIKSSLALGALPDGPGTVSWLPADVVAQCILDLAFSSEILPIAMNLVHPRPLSWTELFKRIRTELIKTLQLEKDTLSLTPFKNWIRALEDKNNDMVEEKLRKLPAIKLLDFFRKMANGDVETSAFATDKTQSSSPTLSGLGELDGSNAERWIKYWHKRGYLCASDV